MKHIKHKMTLNFRKDMNFVLDPSKYDMNYLYTLEPVSNNVIENGVFYRLIYSNMHMTLNSLIFKLNFSDVILSKNFNKYKMSLNPNDHINKVTFCFLEQLEKDLLDKFKLKENKQYCIKDAFINDALKLYSDKEFNDKCGCLQSFIKISGFWVKDNTYGITYKISI